jgi:phage-related protein
MSITISFREETQITTYDLRSNKTTQLYLNDISFVTPTYHLSSNHNVHLVVRDDIDYATVARVIESWEKCRVQPGFSEKFGTLVLLK